MQSISWYRVQSDEARPEAVRVAVQDTVAPSAGSDPAAGSVAVAPPSASLNKSDSVSNLGSASKPPIPPRPEKEKSREDSSRKLNAGSGDASAESGSGSRARPVPPLPTGSSQRMKSSDLEERPPPAAPPEDERASANRLESALSHCILPRMCRLLSRMAMLTATPSCPLHLVERGRESDSKVMTTRSRRPADLRPETCFPTLPVPGTMG